MLSVLEGSKVSLGALASRELAQAEMLIQPLITTPEGNEIPDTEKEARHKMLIRNTELWSPVVDLPADPCNLQLRWTDTLGLNDSGGFKLRVEPIPDEAPSPYIQGSDRQLVLLEEETIEFQVAAEDDYGIREIGLDWRGEFTKPTDDSPAVGSLTLTTGTPNKIRLNSDAIFSPSVLGITPQKLTLRAYAEDYYPQRGRVYSKPITLFILTRDEHATMLKNQFDRIIGELEDVARREQNQFDENRRIERLDPEDIQSEQTQKRLQQQQQNEEDNTERMQKLAERMEELFKDSTRNGEINKDTMKKMADTLQNMQELSQQDMPEVTDQLSQSQDQRSTAEQAKSDVEKAIAEQKEVLEKMQDTIAQANEANRNFEASTFVNRLKRAASEEDGIASRLINLIDNLIGLPIEELDPADQRIISELTNQQRKTASDIRWIQEDLGHFYARTQKEIHKELLLEMQSSRIDTALDDNRQRIAENRTYQAITASKMWADKIREWVAKLEGDQNQAGGGGGGGGGDQEDEDFEFMLKVMRMIQQEQDIRYRTRALEQLRRSLGLDDPDPQLEPQPTLN